MAENKFVIKTIWNEDNSIIRTQYVESRERAEQAKELYDYGYECLHGKGQTEVTVVIEKV